MAEKAEKPKNMRALRVNEDDWQRIRELAEVRHMSVSEYIRRCALGILDGQEMPDTGMGKLGRRQSTLERKHHELDERVQRLESLIFRR